MSTPQSFNPQPVGAQGGLPLPQPPKYLKHEIYSDPSVFKHIDDHSINVSTVLFSKSILEHIFIPFLLCNNILVFIFCENIKG